MIKYGLISDVDARCLEKTLDLIMQEFVGEKRGAIRTCEIGVFDGETSRGINKYISQNARMNIHTAIDNNKDKPILKPFAECNLIIGDSHEVYNQLADESQHLLFVDGNHTVFHVIGDFHCYASKVKKGCYLAFHDTGKHIGQFKDYQGSGSKDDPDNYIGVRRALGIIGLLSNEYKGWELVFDEADETDLAGGICVFRKTI